MLFFFDTDAEPDVISKYVDMNYHRDDGPKAHTLKSLFQTTQMFNQQNSGYQVASHQREEVFFIHMYVPHNQ